MVTHVHIPVYKSHTSAILHPRTQEVQTDGVIDGMCVRVCVRVCVCACVCARVCRCVCVGANESLYVACRPTWCACRA